MGTSYYRLRQPITSIKLQHAPGHDKLRIYVNHASTGVLTLRNEETREFILGLADKNEPVMYSYWGGLERGTVVGVYEKELPNETQVLSSYGELLTVAQVKARHGAKRKNEMPTEYEVGKEVLS